jgi:uncharacterized protein YutE (UPF0331/DUF86 family)
MDHELIAKRLAFIETCLRELRTNARLEVLETDLREQRYIEHTLQLAIQGALDVASHVVSDARLGEPRTNRELFELLARHHALDIDLTRRLSAMAGFRDILVHGYTDVDLGIVRDVVANRLVDLDDFIAAMRARSQHTTS